VERSHDPITIIGTGFNPLSVVWQGVTTYPTTPISETELTFDSHGIRDGVRPIKVKSTGSDVYSNELPLTVTDVPTPTITSITPDTFSLAAGPIPAVIVGTNFVDGAIIDGKAAPSIPFTQPTTFVSPTELHANFDPAGMGIGQGLVAIRNPDEGVSSNIAYYVEA
jgi:hypothetical protein